MKSYSVHLVCLLFLLLEPFFLFHILYFVPFFFHSCAPSFTFFHFNKYVFDLRFVLAFFPYVKHTIAEAGAERKDGKKSTKDERKKETGVDTVCRWKLSSCLPFELLVCFPCVLSLSLFLSTSQTLFLCYKLLCCLYICVSVQHVYINLPHSFPYSSCKRLKLQVTSDEKYSVQVTNTRIEKYTNSLVHFFFLQLTLSSIFQFCRLEILIQLTWILV